jgi:hypothetical protein
MIKTVKSLLIFILLGLSSAIYAGSEDLTVSSITRLSHPWFQTQNLWKGRGHPINPNNTKILMDEYISFEHPDHSAGFGRGVVVGDIAALKAAVNVSDEAQWLTDYLAATKPLNDDFLSYTCVFYYPTAPRNVGCLNDWTQRHVRWSPIPGEEDILYGIYDKIGYKQVIRIDTNDGSVTVVGNYVAEYNADNTIDAFLTGWKWDTQELIISFRSANNYGDGVLMDVSDGSKTAFSGHPFRSSAEGLTWHKQYGVHGDTSPNKRFRARYAASTQINGVLNNDCTDVSEKPCDTDHSTEPSDWLDPNNSYTPTHINWAASNNWFIAGGLGNPLNKNSPTPYLTTQTVAQIYFDNTTHTFETHIILTHDSCGFWGGGENNYNELPSPSMNDAGTMIVFQGTDGKYSYFDYQQDNEAYADWDTNGVWLAELSGEAPPEQVSIGKFSGAGNFR